MYQSLVKELTALQNPRQAKLLSGFFKTGKGQYGEGDRFLGIKVPVIRGLVKKYQDLPRSDILKLLKSPWHEHRLTALLIMVRRFEKTREESVRKTVFEDYLANTRHINNWDLVDLSAPNIVGTWLLDKDRKVLYGLARSKDLWERRIAVLATYAFIRKGESKDTFAISGILMKDGHDLIHKAVGWMLREVGKRVSEPDEQRFLEKHCRTMPRTMLRYAIERFGEKDKRRFMRK
jgi:3-methyladenine DNA glycosylase AlkD